jgi:hypothetical protein
MLSLLNDGAAVDQSFDYTAFCCRFLRSSTVTIIIDGAAFCYCNARSSGSEAELCLHITVNNNNDDDVEDNGGNDVALHSIFENLEIWSHFAADLRSLTPYRVELIAKRWIFGLDTTINR